jgi:ubiquinone/menaquinone biosynthesis C-methylase UbiE
MTKTKEEIAAGYDAIVDRIGIDNDFYTRVLDIQGKISGNVLDIGCGRGQLLTLAKTYADKDTKFFGLDISPKLVEIAQKSNPNAEVVVGDAEKLPYEDNKFDYVFMTECLEHLLDYQKALSEVSRVLKPEGVFVVTVPNRDWLQYDFYKPYIDKNEFQPVQDHYFTYQELRDLLKSCGFLIEKVKGTDNLFYYGWKHKFEQVAAFFYPKLHKKMKRLIVKTNTIKKDNSKPKVGFMTYAIDNRKGKGTALVGIKTVEGFLKHRDEFELVFLHYEKAEEEIYKHGVREIIFPTLPWPFNRRSFRMIYFFLTTKEKFDCLHWFQPFLYPFYWVAPTKHIFCNIHGGGRWENQGAWDWTSDMYNWTFRLFHKKLTIGTAGSTYAFNDIVDAYKIHPDKVRLLHYGAEKDFYPRTEEEKADLKKRLNLPDKFLLNVARMVVEKNAYGVMKAFDQYLTKNPDNKDLHLVNIGMKSTDAERVMNLYNNSKFKDRIHLLEHVAYKDLQVFYGACLGLVFPLMKEGLGLPTFEAMRSGTPTVTALTAFPEVTNEDTILVNAYDVDDIERGIKKLVEDDANREKIAKNGFNFAQKFTWDYFKDNTIKLYREMLNM